MRRRRISGLGRLSLTALTLIVGTQIASPVPPSTVEQAESLSKADRVARAFLETLNELRQARGAQPLQLSGPLSGAARILLDRAVIEPSITGFDPNVGLTREDLRAAGYDPQQWAVGLASSSGEPFEIVAFWRQSDPASFEAFLEPGLRDFGLAEEIWALQPAYALVAAVSRAQTHQPIIERLSALDIVRGQLLERVNEERDRNGLVQLRRSRQLDAAAQSYAERMMKEGFYGHVSPQGETVHDRIQATGYRPEYTGENLASGPDTAELAMDSWMDSKGHRKNILDRRFRDVGFGVSVLEIDGELKILWVQCFGRRRP